MNTCTDILGIIGVNTGLTLCLKGDLTITNEFPTGGINP
jgi:hypothetical protein